MVKSCVHCHQIEDSLRLEQRDKGRTFRSGFSYPAPETIGMEVEPVIRCSLKASCRARPFTGPSPSRRPDSRCRWAARHQFGGLELGSSSLSHGSVASSSFCPEGNPLRSSRPNCPSGWRLKSDVPAGSEPGGGHGLWRNNYRSWGCRKRSLGLDGGDLALRAEHRKHNQHAAAHAGWWRTLSSGWKAFVRGLGKRADGAHPAKAFPRQEAVCPGFAWRQGDEPQAPRSIKGSPSSPPSVFAIRGL